MRTRSLTVSTVDNEVEVDVVVVVRRATQRQTNISRRVSDAVFGALSTCFSCLESIYSS